jgi:hypothetical protein
MTDARVHDVEREPAVGAEASRPRVLVFTTLFPNAEQPLRGVFVRHRVAAVARHCPTQVVAPILHRGNRCAATSAQSSTSGTATSRSRIPLHDSFRSWVVAPTT